MSAFKDINKYSAARSYMLKHDRVVKDFQRPLYLRRLRNIILGKPDRMSFEAAALSLLNTKAYIDDNGRPYRSYDLSIFPNAPEPTAKQNDNTTFVESCFDIFGRKRTIDALIIENKLIEEMLK